LHRSYIATIYIKLYSQNISKQKLAGLQGKDEWTYIVGLIEIKSLWLTEQGDWTLKE
jgi:hypothetical protein